MFRVKRHSRSSLPSRMAAVTSEQQLRSQTVCVIGLWLMVIPSHKYLASRDYAAIETRA